VGDLVSEGMLADVDHEVTDLGFYLYCDNEYIHVDWSDDPSSNPVLYADENFYGSGILTLCVSDGEYEVCSDAEIAVLPVNDAPYFHGEMHAPVGLNMDFHVPVHTDDIDSDSLALSFENESGVPYWVSLDENIIHGVPDALGYYPLVLSLSDGDTTALDTFHLHVENFSPVISSIEDVPDDQGGRVYINFERSYFDVPNESGQYYTVYRHDLVSDSMMWVGVGSFSATGSDIYTAEVSTLLDSSVIGDGDTEFRLIAFMSEDIFQSETMSGYSVDNIAPPAPTGVVASQIGTDIVLSWNPMDIEDLNHYSIYRSETSEFEIGADNFIGESTVHSFTDTTAEWLTSYFYKLNATDYAGNIGPESVPVEGYVYVNLPPALVSIDSQYVDEDQSLVVLLYATDTNEEDVLEYSAFSTDEGISLVVESDTLHIAPDENWYGISEIMVSVTDGELTDSTVFVLTVNGVNDAPGDFSLLSPEDSSLVLITNEDIDSQMQIGFAWEESIDIDNDELEYHFKLYSGNYSETNIDPVIDTLVNGNSVDISYEFIADVIGITGGNTLSGDWFVITNDGSDTTMSNQVRYITLDASDVLSVDGDLLPGVFALHQNYPNPFNPTTQIKYDLPHEEMVSIVIYDVTGRQVKVLVNKFQPTGYRSVRWSATNNFGESVSAGIYIYTIQAGTFRQVRKMLLLK